MSLHYKGKLIVYSYYTHRWIIYSANYFNPVIKESLTECKEFIDKELKVK